MPTSEPVTSHPPRTAGTGPAPTPSPALHPTATAATTTTTTTTTGATTGTPERRTPAAVLDVVIPVYNEAAALGPCVQTLAQHLSAHFPYPCHITIVDNASTDATWAVATDLAEQLPGVRALHLDAKGRGGALKTAWLASTASVVAYMDVDLSTDLAALLPLVAPLVSGHSDVAIGTRLARSSHVVRGPKREVISRCYNVILRSSLRVRFTDAQCGFKALRKDVADALLPMVTDTGWFFDTELLVLAERAGLRIHEVPVDWVDDPDSRVDLLATAAEDLRGVWRLATTAGRGRLPLSAVRAALPHRHSQPAPVPTLLSQVIRFGLVGLVSTLAYALLYLALRSPIGPQGANLAALLITAVLNTSANRRLTFGVRGRSGAGRHQAQGLVVFALCWALTAGSLAGLHAWFPGAAHLTEVVVLTVANLVGTALRFLMLRVWVFRQQRSTALPDST